ncbi:glycine-rich domain-containing protein [Nocardia sp. NPDC051030]|uniref:glycine-rich domain-containing protein n=1 Tax=Nocardia sp. NPDC051030 TaxID=3155162 RepID=UPI00342E1B7A
MTTPDRKIPDGAQVSGDFGGLRDGRDVAFSGNDGQIGNYSQQTFRVMTTSAMSNVVQKANFQMGNYVTAAIDEMLAGLCRALAGVEVLGLHPLGFLNDWANNLDAQAKEALSGMATISKGITGPITGTASGKPSDVLPAMTTLQTRFQQILLQGNATVITSSQNYTPTKGILSLDVILIGGGGGGGGGRWDLLAGNRAAGGGGGGGGEVHTSIPASLLPVDSNGNFLPIPITVGVGGTGGPPGGWNGTNGTDTALGRWLAAGGGLGGLCKNGASTGSGGLGGYGMIPGGTGGKCGANGADDPNPAPGRGGDSISGYALYGGGGGGGGGAGFTGGYGQAGGQGGISSGGPPGAPGAPGTSPSAIVATGGGGGGGGFTGYDAGGPGAFPAGGGGGGGGNATGAANGGNGAAGIVFLIERTS